jgi:hypothetical protein
MSPPPKKCIYIINFESISCILLYKEGKAVEKEKWLLKYRQNHTISRQGNADIRS